MKRTPFLALSLVFVLPLTDGMAEPKKNEIFGFGRKRNQISNALFPGGTETGTGPAAFRPEVERDSDTIFRGGKPKKVKSAAYLIKDGEKIEQPLPGPREKTSLFSKFRKDNSEANPLLTATNASVEEEKKKPNRILPPIPLKKEKNEDTIVAAPSAPAVVSETPEESYTAPTFTAAPMDEPVEEKKSGGLFSFFSRDKKKEEGPAIAAPIPVAEAATGQETPTVATVTETSSSTGIPNAPGYEERAPVATKPVPAPKPASDSTPTENTSSPPVPVFAETTTKEEKKEKKGLSLPNPIAAFKSEPKPVSLEGAETIIENGEIVTEQDDIVDSNIVKTGDGKKDPPRMVDGVKTYDSWEDVEGRNVSAADKIISQMRQR